MPAARLSDRSPLAALAIGLAPVGCATETPDAVGNTVSMGGMSAGPGGAAGTAGRGEGGLIGGGSGGTTGGSGDLWQRSASVPG